MQLETDLSSLQYRFYGFCSIVTMLNMRFLVIINGYIVEFLKNLKDS